jgi:hypothetical protein
MWISPGSLPSSGILSKNIRITPTATSTTPNKTRAFPNPTKFSSEFRVPSSEFRVSSFEFQVRVNLKPCYNRFTTSFMIAVILGSALFATAMTSAIVTGFSASGEHSSVMIDTPNTLMFM